MGEGEDEKATTRQRRLRIFLDTRIPQGHNYHRNLYNFSKKMPLKFYNVTVQARNSEFIDFGHRPFRNTKSQYKLLPNGSLEKWLDSTWARVSFN